MCEVLLGDNKIGSFFKEGNVTAAKYLDLLQQQIVPEIRMIAGDRFSNTSVRIFNEHFHKRLTYDQLDYWIDHQINFLIGTK